MSELWYRKPAKVWEEALPLGNGRIGAMVFGNIENERIQVNEESVWYGGKKDRINPDAREYLPKVRELIREGRIQVLGTDSHNCSRRPPNMDQAISYLTKKGLNRELTAIMKNNKRIFLEAVEVADE